MQWNTQSPLRVGTERVGRAMKRAAGAVFDRGERDGEPRVPSPPHLSGGFLLIGHMVEFSQNPFAHLVRAREEFGEIGSFQLLNQKIVMLSGPAANEAFFRAPDDQLCRREAYKVMTPIFGEGVVFDAPLPRMNSQLQMIMPLLRDQIMRTYPAIIAEESNAIMNDWGEAGVLDMLATMKALTLYTSTRCLIGNEFRSGITDEVVDIYHHLEKGIHPLAYLLPNAPIPKFRRRNKARARLQEIVEALMERRQKNPDPPQDGLQLLIEATYDDGMHLSANELTGMIVALILAGHHTSAGTATWVIVEMLRNPKILERVRDEVDDILWPDQALTYPHLRRMTELGSAIKETLRLHPPLIFLFRKVLREFHYGGYTVQPGSFLCASPAVSHRLADVFSEPNRFDIDRYGPERAEGHRTAWIAFGGGKHKCTGNAFGILQLKAIIATMLRRYDFKLVDDDKSYHDNYKTATVQPKGPVRLAYRARPRIDRPRPHRVRTTGPTNVTSGRTRVMIDHHLCQGHAVCVSEAAAVFALDADSVAGVCLESEGLDVRVEDQTLSFSPPPCLNAMIAQAAKHCPNQAIIIRDLEQSREV